MVEEEEEACLKLAKGRLNHWSNVSILYIGKGGQNYEGVGEGKILVIRVILVYLLKMEGRRKLSSAHSSGRLFCIKYSIHIHTCLLYTT